jgi:hypothetical protein
LLPCQHLFRLPNTSSYTNNQGHIRCTCTLYPECSSSYNDRRWAPPPASKRKGSGAFALNLHSCILSPHPPRAQLVASMRWPERSAASHSGGYRTPTFLFLSREHTHDTAQLLQPIQQEVES